MKSKKYFRAAIGIVMLSVGIVLVLVLAKKDTPEIKFCTEMYSGKKQQKLSEYESTKGTGAVDFFWTSAPGMPLRLRVKFLNGTKFQTDRVKLYAEEWVKASEQSANGQPKIQFTFLPPGYTGKSEIRILFEPGGSQSAIGNDALNFPANAATMTLGWVEEGVLEEEIRQVILHEFGHALGLIHEHQRPDAPIRWDSLAVYNYYATTQNPPWTRDDVNYNIFTKYNRATVNSPSYDPKSIMHYAIPDYLTKDKCCGVDWNDKLSTQDVSIIRKMYPLTPCPWPDDCCFNSRGIRIPCQTNKSKIK